MYRKLFKSLILLIPFSLIIYTLSIEPSQKNTTIAILQFIEHPALDETRRGIIETLQKNSPNANIIWDSAQGNPAIATQIAQNYIGQDVDAIVAIATVSAQVAVTAAQESGIPVIFSSVTDPQSARLLGRSTGVVNYIDAQRQLDIVWKAVPNIKTLGMIYNPGEPFSEYVLQATEEVCQSRGINFLARPVMKSSDIGTATESIVNDVDAIFINNDNLALASFSNVVAVANLKNIPVFASDIDVIDKGAVAAIGANQYQVGIQTAGIVLKALEDPKLFTSIPIEVPEKIDLRVNPKQADVLGIDVSVLLDSHS